MTDYEAATAFLGEWGRFQQQVFFLLCLTVVPNGFTGLSVVFVADTPAHRCLVPAHLNLSAAWRNSSIPPEEEEESRGGAPVPSRCSRYRLEDVLRFSQAGLLPGVDVNLSNVATEGCLDGWEYDQSVYTSTIVSEWDLVCDDKWKKPLTSSLFFFGVLTGSFISGQISDRSRMTDEILFDSRTELLGLRARTIFSTAGVNLFFAAGYMLLPLFAYFIRDWRTLLLGLTLPGFLFVPMWWYIPESPRWLLSQGRVKEAEAIIRDAAKRNRIEPPAVIFDSNQKECQSERRKAHNICDLLRSRNIRWVSVTLWLVWNTVTIAYFALSLNTGNLHGNVYFNCFLSALVEIPAYTLSWVMFRWCSRRLALSSTLFLGGLFLLLIQLIPARSYSVSLPYILMGSLTTLFGLLSLLLPESYGMPLPDTITHMQHFPGCCRKTPYTLTRTVEKENTAEMKSPVVSLEQGATPISNVR
ncbi:hypothetical protein L3Q82_006560 [Scortum barcoo]|uniref:Uncharacterized protein n=1 Tax=Scortum barcoo TaxID=214431 RepID=A0ACB8WZM0_9TELE|nr:hypothetical protein L3Q82_006560 [Scortum barcoo]